MGKINGMEDIRQLPPKVCRMYKAVVQMLEEGMAVGDLRVSTITEQAGIGKGTAYEYFDSKEEIVACALLYQMRSMFGWLETALKEQGGFREQLNFLLTEVEKREQHKNCFLRFLHMMTDNSEFNRMLQKKMHEEAFAPYLPMNVFARVMQQGMEKGGLRTDIPLDYMVHCLFSHLLVYMMAVTNGGFFHADLAAVRPLVYQGILNELGKRNNIL